MFDLGKLTETLEEATKTQALLRMISMADAMLRYQKALTEGWVTERQRDILRRIIRQLEDYLEDVILSAEAENGGKGREDA